MPQPLVDALAIQLRRALTRLFATGFQLLLEDSKFGEWRIRVRLTFAPVGASLDVFRTQGRIPVGPLIARLALGSVGTVLLPSTIRPVGTLLVLARSATRGLATLLTSILALLRR